MSTSSSAAIKAVITRFGFSTRANQELDRRYAEQQEHTGYWGSAGAGCLFLAEDTGRILWPLRSSRVNEPGTWGTWGGAIDPGEDPQEATRREALEEAGYKGKLRLIPLLVYRDPPSDGPRKDSGTGFRYHNFCAVVPHEFTPRLNWETSRAEWRALDDLPSPLHPGVRELLKDSASLSVLRELCT